jgi:serine/threonine-protein kinase RsbW
MNDKISFLFPAKAEYISAIRLAASGVACSFDFNVSKIEDIKSCIAEACLLLMYSQTCESLNILLECDGEIKVRVCALGAERILPVRECVEFNEEMSKIMIEALSQHVSFIRQDEVLSEVYFVIKPEPEE